jgi:hypothetical protein
VGLDRPSRFQRIAFGDLDPGGSSLIGSITLTSSSCFSGGPLSGTVAGNQISAVITISGSQVATLTATVDASGNIINGSYGVTSGPCAGDKGIFNLTRGASPIVITPGTPSVGSPR